MHRSTARWTTAAATAALLALPAAGAAQSTGTTPQQPPAQAQPQHPPSHAQPQQPPAQAQPQQTPATPAEQQTPAGQVDANAAKKHLSEARDALSQITSMPEAAKLQGDSRTQVSQLISNFNELITTQAEWRAAYAKVDANLSSLLGPEDSEPAAAAGTAVGTAGAAGTAGVAGTAGTAGTAGAAGTTGAAGATAGLEPAIRAKLAEFRMHLKEFEKAAGGGASSGAMAPSAATASTSNPANPAASATGTPATPDPAAAAPTPSSAGSTGTSGVTASPTAGMASTDQAKAAEQVAHSEADKHLDAISEILNQSKTGTLTKAQTAELKKHVEQLRSLLKQGR